MPYVPSEKTNPPAEDRKILDAALEPVAIRVAQTITKNQHVSRLYRSTFMEMAKALERMIRKEHMYARKYLDSDPITLAKVVYSVGQRHGYYGADLGELNYALTRFIQRVPQIKVANGDWKPSDELRYWLYAATARSLTYAHIKTVDYDSEISGVFEDIKDEYKWRVNRSYEIAQILKSGDCYDTPFYTRLVRVMDRKNESVIGYLDLPVPRSDETLGKDLLDYVLYLERARKTT